MTNQQHILDWADNERGLRVELRERAVDELARRSGFTPDEVLRSLDLGHGHVTEAVQNIEARMMVEAYRKQFGDQK